MDENKNRVVEIKTGTTKVIEFKPLASAIKFAALCGVIAVAVYVTKNPNYLLWLAAWAIID